MKLNNHISLNPTMACHPACCKSGICKTIFTTTSRVKKDVCIILCVPVASMHISPSLSRLCSRLHLHDITADEVERCPLSYSNIFIISPFTYSIVQDTNLQISEYDLWRTIQPGKKPLKGFEKNASQRRRANHASGRRRILMYSTQNDVIMI